MGVPGPIVEGVAVGEDGKIVFTPTKEAVIQFDRAAASKDYDNIRKMGESAGRTIMREILPEGTLGQLVDTMYQFIATRTTVESGWYPVYSFVAGGLESAMTEQWREGQKRLGEVE